MHCPISKKEGCTTLRVAVDKEGPVMDGMPSFGRGAPFFQTQGLWPLGSGRCALPVDLSVVLAQLMPTGHHSFRLLLEESTFQALR